MRISHKILVVDDEPDIRKLFAITLTRMGFDHVLCSNLAEAKQTLENHAFALCLTDMRLPDGDGMDLVSHLQKNFSHIPVIMITAHGNVNNAIEAMKRGCFDFLSKPIDLKELRKIIANALKIASLPDDKDSSQLDDLVGTSPVIRSLKKKIKTLARSQVPVHIHGESGTGKELIARLIHTLGPRSPKAFVAVNCGAIPSELMESEFFGHLKGSFTGAVADKKGFFQSADGGTLFLDEIAELPLLMQVKLLRVIQERRVRPIGDNTEHAVDVRILSATHQRLDALVQAKAFRHDLFYRLNVIKVTAPPLRDHLEDLPLLADHILSKLSKRLERPKINLDPSALHMLQSYTFPGNIRELENILERALALNDEEISVILADDVELTNVGGFTHPEIQQNTATILPSSLVEQGLKDMQPQQGDGDASINLDTLLDSWERKTITDALTKTGGNKSATAKLLNISLRSLRYRISRLNIE